MKKIKFVLASIFIILSLGILFYFFRIDNVIEKDLDGLKISYHENGAIAAEIYFKNNKPIGEALYYNEDRDLEKFQYYDSDGNLRFDCKYSINNQIVEKNGKPFFLKILKNDKMQYSNDTLSIYPNLIYPPYCLNKLEIFINSNEVQYLMFEKYYTKGENQPFFKHKLLNDSIKDFKFISKLFNMDTLSYSSDTIIYLNYMYEGAEKIK
ncbi:MAG: hypothetical protein R2774_01510 [Saprospiraceae bacterium]